jgi:N-acetylglucosamine-6-sulfatase
VIRITTLWAIAAGFGTALSAQAAPTPGPCEQIAAACRDAGFVQGGAAKGDGIRINCIGPIMQGTAAARNRGTALPAVDPQLVAACKGAHPEFGQQKAQRTDAVAAQNIPAPAQSALPPARIAPGARPNIVFVLTDDLAWNLVQYMPHVLKMQQEGATFANYFVTDSLCCPSRSSIFTGRFPHDTGIFRNTGKDGGYLAFHNRGHEQATFAAALSAAGYRTAMLGKYLNGYLPAQHPPAPGWSTWAVAGNGYAGFRYSLNQDGSVVQYGDKPADYMTDVLSGVAVRFIKQSVGAPFFIEIATFAPHAPYTPAPRDGAALPAVRAPRTPAFDAAPDADAPKWLRSHPQLSDADVARIDKDFRKRAQSVLAIDTMIGELQAAVAAIGAENNTYFVFSSDNGYHMGEHRLMPGKMTAFDTDIHVPLIVTGPGVPAGLALDEIVENIDLCSTFTELGGASAPASVDGRSLVPLLRGQKVPQWRTLALVEHRGPHKDPSDPDAPSPRGGNPTTYEAIRSRTSVYVEYDDGEKEYHDRVTDPQELRNTFSSLPANEKTELGAMLDAMKRCHGDASCWESASQRRRATPR